MNKYSSPDHKFNEWVDRSTSDLVDIVKKDSAGLERADLKAIILELATRLKEQEDNADRGMGYGGGMGYGVIGA